MSGRTVFTLVAGAVLAFALYAVVLQPAVARGGWAELVLVIVAFLLILGGERWMRTR